MSELEKVKAEVNAIYEGLSNIVSRLSGIQETWDQGGKVGAEAVALEKTVKQLPWEDGQGNKGPYEWVTKHRTRNSPPFQALQKALQDKDGHLSLEEHYYWLGSEGTAIFRRRKKKR